MSNNLKSKTLHALFWSFLERFGQQGIQFVISTILARLLLPEEFGQNTMLTIFMAITQPFINNGLDQTMNRKQDAALIDKHLISYFSGTMK